MPRAAHHIRSPSRLGPVLLLAVTVLLATSSACRALPPTYNTGGTGWDRETLAAGTGWSSARASKLRGPGLKALNSQLSLRASRQALNSPVAPGGGSGSKGRDEQGRAAFTFHTPIANLPGRGMDLALNLYYNSQVWVGNTSDGFTFDANKDWPAPGFQLGFGRIGHFGAENYIVDADGTIHSAVLVGQRGIPGRFEHSLRTVDGSFIEYRIELDNTPPYRLRYGVARLPNGTEVQFGGVSDADPNVVFPTKITDVQGNTIQITYRPDHAPEIDTMVDTVGRVVRFHYDPDRALTAITAPGYAGGPERVLARLHYRYMALTQLDAFVGRTNEPCLPSPGLECFVRVLDAVFYPATSTGYWMGGVNSAEPSAYSPYGMLAHVSERRGMSMSFSSPDPLSTLNEQGGVNPGLATRDRYYNYPLGPANLKDVPAFTQMYECWVAAPSDAPNKPDRYVSAVYHYQTDKATRTSTTYLPPGAPIPTATRGQPQYPETQPIPNTARVVEKAYVRNEKDRIRFDDGLPEYTEILDASGRSLRRTTSAWEPGDDQGYPPLGPGRAYNPRLSQVDHRDERGVTRSTRYDYGPWNNQVFRVSEYDFGGALVQTTETEYENDPLYRAGTHILNLPKVIRVRDGPSGAFTAVTEIAYDEGDLQPTPGAVGHDERFVRGSPQFDPYTGLRGLPTTIRRYADPAGRDAATAQEERREYDDTGNLVRVNGSACCEQMGFVFLPETQYSQPSRMVQGAADPASPIRVQEGFAYDFATGLPTRHVDANGRTSLLFYEPGTLRLQSETLPAKDASRVGPRIEYSYDPMALSTTATTLYSTLSAGTKIASRTVRLLDGRGSTREQRSQAADGSSWDVVAGGYDALQRLTMQSMPYRLNPDGTVAGQVVWTKSTFDALGRMTAREAPAANGQMARSYIYFNETPRPPAASAYIGSTVRVVDPVGRERWVSFDPLGRVREVLEPNPESDGSSGSVSGPGAYQTMIGYSGPHVSVTQGERDFAFRYDGLGRLTHQLIPGRDGTLRGPEGQGYSDAFEYDRYSNLVRRTDAQRRGPLYVYENDPLRRLQRIERDPPPVTGINVPRRPPQTTTFEYVKSGDLRRLRSAATAGVNTETYGYDSEDRLSSLTQKLAARPGSPFETGFAFDEFDRLHQITYPARSGIGGTPRRTVAYRFGADSRPDQVLVDGQPFVDGIGYDPSGNVRKLDFLPGRVWGDRIRETYEYYGNGALRSQSIARTESGQVLGQPLVQATYNYHPSGQLLSIRDSDPASNRTFEYDALARLTKVTGPGTPTASWELIYGYDRFGNRTNSWAAGTFPGGVSMPPDGNNLSVAASGRITSPGYGYNAAGELIQRRGIAGKEQTLDYDQDSRLSSVVLSGPPCLPSPACAGQSSTTAEVYRYGADRRRLSSELTESGPYAGPTPPPPKVTGRSHSLWAANQVLADFVEGGNPLQIRWARDHIYLGSRRLATIDRAPRGPKPIGAEVLRRHHPGPTGTRLITKSPDTGTLADNVLPFGTVITDSAAKGAAAANRRFGGYERSPKTGLDYALNRFYDPVIGRFVQPDPLGLGAIDWRDPQTANGYSYARNDPVNRADPLGLRECEPAGGSCPPTEGGGGTDTPIYDGGTADEVEIETVIPPPATNPLPIGRTIGGGGGGVRAGSDKGGGGPRTGKSAAGHL